MSNNLCCSIYQKSCLQSSNFHKLNFAINLREGGTLDGMPRDGTGVHGFQIIISNYSIIGRGWAKYRDLSVVSRSIICWSRTPRQIIDLRDTDKSQYFWSPSSIIIVLSFDHRVFFLRNIFGKRSDLPFSRKSDRKKEKSMVSFTHEQSSISDYHSMQMFRPFHWLRAHHVTCK